MNPVIALALRRAMILSGAIGSAMIAHTVVSGELLLTPMTPIWWGLLTFVAMLVGRRTGWQPRGVTQTLALLGALQLTVHVVMGAVPWLFGLDVHHLGGLMSPEMLAAHLVALLMSAWLIARAEQIIDRSMWVAARIARALTDTPRRRAPRSHLLRLPALLAPADGGPMVIASRGPPPHPST